MKTKKGKKQNERKECKRNANFKKKKKKKCRRLNPNDVFLKAMDLPNTRKNMPRKEKKECHSRVLSIFSETKTFQFSSNKIQRTSFRGLSYMSDLEGLVVLGRIKVVRDLYLVVDLPEGISGIVPATNISMEYVSKLTSFIVGRNEEYPSQIYKIGQLVLTRIESVTTDLVSAFDLPVEQRMKPVKLSMKPEDVNSELSSEDFKVGLLVSAAVRSIEETVYVMNCGVINVRTFLSKDQSLKYESLYNNGRQLVVGQVILCVVTSSSIGSTSSDSIIVSLSLDPELLAKAYPVIKKILRVPGMIYNVKISEITEEGVIVQFSSGENAFVSREYIDDFKEVEIGQQFLARILYIVRPNENVYMTMLENLCYPVPQLNFIIPGFYGKAKIVDVHEQAFTLKLGDSSLYGLARIKSLQHWTKLQKTKPKFLKYCVNRIVDYRTEYYDFMLEKFICQILPSSGPEPIKCNGMTLGKVSHCEIESRNDGYLTVGMLGSSRSVKGIVNWIHYHDKVSKENIHIVESRIPLRSPKQCKIISVSPVLELSLRHSFMNYNRSILYKFEQGECNVPYDGIVEEITSEFLKVKFYNNFVCFVPQNNVEDGLKCSLKESYKEGELVTCYIRQINHLTGEYYMEVKKVVRYRSRK